MTYVYWYADGFFQNEVAPKMESYQSYHGMSAICQLLNIEKMWKGSKTNNVISFNI